MSLETVQKLFNGLFPFLKIDFWEKELQQSTTSSKKKISNKATVLKQFSVAALPDEAITIQPDMTVAELENAFSKKYRLDTQIFRRSGNIWLETTVTDSWSLAEQNKQGEMITLQLMNKNS